ncbi:gtp cyclohydrolase 1 [Ophiostoma piceae UAMH 11346]|uniref:GTP cyclohydrolase 1 n=1 Tax=Ophiostoma piceae (strain UAMH 11346) TaxID=1262450 RepID=S3C9E5_OPHP1|nr:gtp cyclohydrolase 1 [Ophiostoma piceae UAMH 11346]
MAGSQNGEAVQATPTPAPAVAEAPGPAPAPVNGETKADSNGNGNGAEDAGRNKKQRRRRARSSNHAAGTGTEKSSGGVSKRGNKNTTRRQPRRHSMSKAARDPRDEPESSLKTRSPTPLEAIGEAAGVSAALTKSPKTATTRSPSPVIDFDGLSRPSIGTRNRLEEGEDDRAKRLEKIRGAVRTILECVGEDPDRSGLLGTPDRYARALLDFTQGYQQNVRNIINNAIFHEGHNEMVIVKDIEVYSLCEHHMVPFTGKMHIGYIPFHSVIGISKLPRIAEMFSRRLQIQERLTKEVANTIMEVLQPQGVAVVMESSHLCMVMRGVQKTTATTITSCVLGCFERKEKTRNEFLNLVGVNRS